MSDRYGPYSSYSADDLLADQRFRRWALDPTPEEDAFWAGLVEHHPRQSLPIAEARHLLGALHDRYDELPLPEGAREQDWQRLSGRLQRPAAPVRRRHEPRRLSQRRRNAMDDVEIGIRGREDGCKRRSGNGNAMHCIFGGLKSDAYGLRRSTSFIGRQ